MSAGEFCYNKSEWGTVACFVDDNEHVRDEYKGGEFSLATTCVEVDECDDNPQPWGSSASSVV